MASVQDFLKVLSAEVGVQESPWGTNTGPRVRQYQSSTGAYWAPWCVSFQQWALKQVGLGPVADRTAGVFYFAGYGDKHGWRINRPVPGAIVCFMNGQGHMGAVESVSGAGSKFTTIEGNAANAVRRRPRTVNSYTRFYMVPGFKAPAPPPKPPPKWLPRFEVVTSENGSAKPRVLLRGKWSAVGPQLPRLLLKYRTAKLRRYMIRNPKAK